jgi:deoxyhypusine synthase
MSWGKFNPSGRFAEVHADATIALPFLVKALMERLGG